MSSRRGLTQDNRTFNFNRNFIPNSSFKTNSDVCGIINIGNNCYLNSGLQILASCEQLVYELDNISFEANTFVGLLKNAFDVLLNQGIYNPEKFINYFCKINYDFIKGRQSCSQNFIRTVIRNINDLNPKIYRGISQYNPSNSNEKIQYENFIKLSNIFPESKVMSIFSIITKSHSYGACPKCREKIDNYSFSYFIDQNMYLDEFYNKCKFSDVLKANMGQNNILTMDCPKCHKEIDVNDETKYIKLPDILIFTLERYQGPTNRVSIEPNDTLNMKEYIDKSLKVDCTEYELFAVNIRFGSTANFGHEICQVKRNGKWYEINDSEGHEIFKLSNFDCSYGLFYRKKGSEKYIIKKKVIKVEQSIPYNIKSIKNDDQDKQITDIKDLPNINKPNINKEYNENNWLNTSLQIIASCEQLKTVLNQYKNMPENLITSKIKIIINNILNNIKPNLDEFINFIKGKLSDFSEPQDFIRKIIIAMNKELLEINNLPLEQIINNNKNYNNSSYEKYKEYIIKNKIYPQSKVYSIFSIMMSHSITKSNCIKCKYPLNTDDYETENDIFLYLPPAKNNKNIPQKYKISQLIEKNITGNKIQMNCKKCNVKNVCYEITKIIKLPEIFIFTLNRFIKENKKIENKVEIIPDIDIDMGKYIHSNYKVYGKTKYKLFAVNIIKENDNNVIDYICQVERNGKWYQIENNEKKDIKNPFIESSYFNYSCGLFYKRC